MANITESVGVITNNFLTLIFSLTVVPCALRRIVIHVVWCGVVCGVYNSIRQEAERGEVTEVRSPPASHTQQSKWQFFSLQSPADTPGSNITVRNNIASQLIRKIFIPGSTSTLTGSRLYQLQLCSNKINSTFFYQSTLKNIYVKNIYIFCP